MSTTGELHTPAHRGRTRFFQFVASIRSRNDSTIDRRIAVLLDNEHQWRLVARLSAFDRAHLLAVHDLLIARGHTDSDLLRAALLHDAGKADDLGRVRIWHRVARVVGRRVAPGIWQQLTSRERDVCRGLSRVEHHAAHGASAIHDAGASPRCCELVSRHEESLPTGDPELDALISADMNA